MMRLTCARGIVCQPDEADVVGPNLQHIVGIDEFVQDITGEHADVVLDVGTADFTLELAGLGCTEKSFNHRVAFLGDVKRTHVRNTFAILPKRRSFGFAIWTNKGFRDLSNNFLGTIGPCCLFHGGHEAGGITRTGCHDETDIDKTQHRQDGVGEPYHVEPFDFVGEHDIGTLTTMPL
jgi:hypothetical protein